MDTERKVHFPRRCCAAAFAALVAAGVATPALAAVVTNNNLTTTALPDLTNLANQSISTVAGTVTNRLVALQANVLLTSGPTFTVNGYIVDSFGGANNPHNFPGGGPPSYSQTNTFAIAVTNTTTLTYTLNTSANHGFVFNATGITVAAPVGADSGLIAGFNGNLVPNASFENASINFFNGGTIVADAAKQGSNVLQVVGTADKFIPIPVITGEQYAYSFWYLANTSAGGQVEYGLNQPQDGFAFNPGNAHINLGVSGWTEVTGTFTPSAGQNLFYISTMANGGYMELDSLFVAAVPEPTTGASIVALSIGIAARAGRRRS